MCDKYVLVEYSSAINTIITNTFQSTQRIKITAFDVSSKYIVFGVNSGGIYIFTREPCHFLKLIPSMYGPANLIAISDNQEHLAVSMNTGLIVILEDCFADAIFQQQTYSEHENTKITAFKWNGNDLYCGDSTGNVSVITLKHFLTKAIFQPSLSVLMHLEAPIVQIDTWGKFLLVSTTTRSVLCDTETERYRQIGKKLRDGPFGACFFNPDPLEHVERTNQRGFFQTVGDNEQLSLTQNDSQGKIYCARPGARLWQADFSGNVILTHQFRASLTSKKQSDILRIKENKLEAVEFDADIAEGFNFRKVFTFRNQFIFTFKEDGFFIFDAVNSELIHWSSQSVKDLKLVHSHIYIWNRTLEISVIALHTIEELILKCLYRKSYNLCGEICLKFFDDLEDLTESSGKIHLVSVLEQKLHNHEMLSKLTQIFAKLKEKSKTVHFERYKNGIVTVNNPEIQENYTKLELNPKQDMLDVIGEQYKIYRVQKNIETIDFTNLMRTKSPDEIYELFRDFIEIESDSISWCKEMFLEHSHALPNIQEASDFLSSAFLEINRAKNAICKCDFPLPEAHKTIPKNAKIGCELMEKSPNFLTHVPYLYKYVLENLNETKDIQARLSILIQFSDSEVLANLSQKLFTYDIWDESLQLFLKLKAGMCLNCGTKIDTGAVLNWNTFALLIVQSINASNALKLLKRHAAHIPQGALNESFYQFCIYSSISGQSAMLKGNSNQPELNKTVGSYLQKKSQRGTDFIQSGGINEM